MSHVVLARKYRPRSFGQMVGQAHVVQALSHALQSGRLHHAYLFTGTRGIGKTTVSRILAKSLNCTGADGQGGVTDQPCGVCQACTEIDADRYIDYIELDAASNRSIDEVRELIERAAYKPSLGRFKVFMIDEAHQLTKDAFNALLKTLEEPPDYLKFVLATTDPDKMLPTVLSRCLQFNLRPMAPEVVHEHLQQVLAAEGVAADAGALRLLSRAARGSMRDALSLTDQAIAYGGGALVEDAVRAMLGSVDRGHAARLVQALAQRDGPAVLATLDTLRGLGLSPAGTLEEIAALLQQMAVEQVVPGALDEHDPEAAAARQLAAELPADETQLLYSIVVHGRAELSLVSDDHAALTMVLLRFLAFPPAGAATGVGGAARSAPLVAAATVARSSAPARPAVADLPPAVTSEVKAVPALRAFAAPAPVAAPTVAAPVSGYSGPRVNMETPAPAPSTRVLRQAATPTQPAVARPSPAAAAAAEPPAVAMPAARGADDPPPWIDDELPDADADGPLSAPTAPRRETPRPAGQARADADGPVSPDSLYGAQGSDGLDDPGGSEDMSWNRSGPAPAPAAPRPAQSVPLLVTALGEQWAQRLRPVIDRGALAALVRELALQAELVDLKPLPEGGQRWHLRVARDTLRAANTVDKLAAALQAAWNEPVQLVVEAGEPQDSIARRDAADREAAQRDAERSIQQDPMVQSLLATFPTARLVPGSVRPVAADRPRGR